MKANIRRITGKAAAYAIPAIISAGLCYVLFTSIDFSEMAAVVRRDCTPVWIAAAMALSIASHVVRAARWRIQLKALGIRCSLWELCLSVFGTYAVNIVFPRLGEIWRTTFIARRRGAPFAQVFGSMVAERTADTLTVLLLTALTFLLASTHMLDYLRGSGAETARRVAELLSSPAIWTAATLLGIAAAVFVLRSRCALAVKIRGIARGLWQGFAIAATMPGRGRWIALTLATWLCYYLQLYLAFFAFPFTASLAAGTAGAITVLVTFTLSSISMGVPSNGGIGPWQWAVIFALASYGVGTTEAGAFANVVLGSQTLLVILLGLFTFACIAISDKHHKQHHNPTE